VAEITAGTAASFQAAERHTRRLAEEAEGASQAADSFRIASLAVAQTEEGEARRAHRDRRAARQAVEKLQARVEAERRRLAERRAEDAVSDLQRPRS
jgi:hypothetical protein